MFTKNDSTAYSKQVQCYNLRCLVLTAIINHDHFAVGVGLAEAAFDGVGDELSAVECRDDDADERVAGRGHIAI